jgi:hypothetical protein
MTTMTTLSRIATVRQRRWWATLAIIAFAFLSLRPACELWLAHRGDHFSAHHGAARETSVHWPLYAPDDSPCCATIERGLLAKASSSIVWRGELPKLLLAPFAAPAARSVANRSDQALIATVKPPGSAPFYMRSRRILR